MDKTCIKNETELDVALLSESEDSSFEDEEMSDLYFEQQKNFDNTCYSGEDISFLTIDHFLKTEIITEDQERLHDFNSEKHIESTKSSHKRPTNPDNWKRNKQKHLRNTGQAYVSYNNKLVPAKDFIPNYDCHCKKKCSSKFTDSDLMQFHETFWKLGNYKLQNQFLSTLISASEIKRRRTLDGSRRSKNFNLNYNIRIGNDTESINVCKTYFLNILRIGWGRVHRIFVKENICFENADEKRRIHKKIIIADIINHIRLFPTFQTPFSRKLNPNRRYLNPRLGIRQMYELYSEKCALNNKFLVKEKYFYGVYTRKFDLHFKAPNSNICIFCESLQHKIDSSENFENRQMLLLQKNLHLNSFERDQIAFKSDCRKASDDTHVCSFDLQKPLPFPKLRQNISFLKRNLFLNNLSFYSSNSKETFMYYWDETEGGRGSQEISSIVLKHLKTYATAFEKIILYSSHQNRSLALVLTLLKFVNDPNFFVKEINLKLMFPGHSFAPNIRDFEIIEKSSRSFNNIYSIEDWLNIFKSTRKKSLKPLCIPVVHTNFFDVTPLKNRIDIELEGVGNFSHIRWFKFEKGNEFSFFYKDNLDGCTVFSEFKLGCGSDKKILSDVSQDCLYKSRRPVSIQKKNDVMDLLEFIPENFRGFYKNLPVCEGVSGVLDEFEEDEVIYD